MLQLQPKTRRWALASLFALCLFLVFNSHSRSGVFNYHSEIWADKAGYYMYLPAFFLYRFEADKFPDQIDHKTGDGFHLDKNTNKVRSKYSCGVALMQAPFFLAAHILASPLGYQPDGFSLIYHRAIDVAAVFYLFWGCIILYYFLARYVNGITSLTAVIFMVCGTNLYYYAIMETGMSHVYSFFLFASFLYLSDRIALNDRRTIVYVFFGLTAGLIFAVRPVNSIVFLVFLMFRPFRYFKPWKNIRSVLLISVPAFLVILPQLIYWKYISGSFFYYSYGNEKFIHIFHPYLAEVWFSACSGLFVYCPLLFLALCGFFFMLRKHPQKSIWTGAYFVLISFLFASWHDWRFGCSFGSRPFVEYYALFSLPFAFFLQDILERVYIRYLILLLIALLCVYTLKISYAWNGCWTSTAWDWKEYHRMLDNL